MSRESLGWIPVIVPDMSRINAFLFDKIFFTVRRTEDDVHHSPCCSPSLFWRLSPQVFIGIIESFDDLFPVFILACSWSWIPLLPESFDEDIPFPVIGQDHEHVSLLIQHDVMSQI